MDGSSLWYVAYGSNLFRARFACYLSGGRPAGGARHYTGCLGPGRYETIVKVGERGGHPMLTFTAPHPSSAAELNAPTAPYLAMLGNGLREAHDWSAARAAAYLAACPGASGAWTRERIAALLGPPRPPAGGAGGLRSSHERR